MFPEAQSLFREFTLRDFGFQQARLLRSKLLNSKVAVGLIGFSEDRLIGAWFVVPVDHCDLQNICSYADVFHANGRNAFWGVIRGIFWGTKAIRNRVESR